MKYPEDYINKIILGDNLKIMKHVPDEVIDLIYLDPPFGENGIDAAYGLNWKDKQHYIDWIEERLIECRRVLKDSGSIYLHCDWHSNAELRLLMNDIFGINNFKNEIIWCYSGGGVSKNSFARKHDTILFYVKDKNKSIFNLQFIGYSDKIGFHYGKVEYTREEKLRGKHLEDWWVMRPIIAGFLMKKEDKIYNDGKGFPHQKSVALLKRIISASSNKGNIVLDPFCGSGTTLVAAWMLSRNYIGIDNSEKAIKISKSRHQLRQIKL